MTAAKGSAKAADALVAKYGKTIRAVGTVCTLRDSKDRALIEALSARGVSDAKVVAILKAEGRGTYGESVIGRHRRGGCKCRQ